jgi:hypothetical protein
MKQRNEARIETVDGINAALAWARSRIEAGLPGGPVFVRVGRARRTVPQNDRMWAMLADVSLQVIWHGQRLTKEEWKDVMTAAQKRQKVVPGVDGGFVVLGISTSRMPKGELAELMDIIEAFGAEQGVTWTDPGEPGVMR